jgi:glyoxylase-like metal-dependent hydrolase (beta-lactamase superfamily II)
MSKFFHYLLAICLSVTLGIATFAQAEAPQVQTQVPGYYRTQFGQFEITALYDGAIEIDTNLLKNVSIDDVERLLSRMFVGNPKMQTAVNAYLINTGDNLVLIDTGAGNLFGPSLGHILENMKAAGYDSAQVDTVIITHLHGDHIGGLNDDSGQPHFPKATIFSSQADNDFWLSPKVFAEATPEIKPFFEMARNSAAPLIATGQWQTFSEGSVIVPGIKAVTANGHTPGHTAYSVESEGQKLLVLGDLVHAHAVQFAQPEVSIEFDIDQQQAIKTRQAIFESTATSKSLVAGMHLPFPGIGHIRAEGAGRYSWVPIEFAPLPPAIKP